MMRRLGLALGVAAIAGVLSVALPAASTTHRARTRIVQVEPWSSADKLKAGVLVARALKGSCWTDSIAVTNTNAYRCVSKNSILDPCFAPFRGRVTRLACMIVPWGKVTWLVLTKRLPRSAHPVGAKPYIWGEQLSNGVRCANAEGAVGRIVGASLFMYCRPGQGFAGAPNRRVEPWTAPYASRYNARRLHRENIHIAWY